MYIFHIGGARPSGGKRHTLHPSQSGFDRSDTKSSRLQTCILRVVKRRTGIVANVIKLRSASKIYRKPLPNGAAQDPVERGV